MYPVYGIITSSWYHMISHDLIVGYYSILPFGANNDATAIALMITVMDTIGSLMRNVSTIYCNLIGCFHFMPQGQVQFDYANKTLMIIFFQGVSGCGCDIIG